MTMNTESIQDKNIFLARALGYRVEKTDTDNYALLLPNQEGRMIVYLPEEDRSFDEWSSEEEAWEQLPDFYGEATETLSLIPDHFHISIMPSEVQGGFFACLTDPNRTEESSVHPFMFISPPDRPCETRAEALAEALLYWWLFDEDLEHDRK